MPKLLQVGLLMTFTLEPPSTTHIMILVPCTRTLIAEFWWSMIVGLWLGSVKWVGMTLCDIYSLDSKASQNRGTRYRSLLMVSVIGKSAR